MKSKSAMNMGFTARRAWKGCGDPGGIQMFDIEIQIQYLTSPTWANPHTCWDTFFSFSFLEHWGNQFKDIIEGKAFRNVIYWYIVRSTMLCFSLCNIHISRREKGTSAETKCYNTHRIHVSKQQQSVNGGFFPPLVFIAFCKLHLNEDFPSTIKRRHCRHCRLS